MKQNYLFKTLFLLCALLVGMSVSAADKWLKTAPADLTTGDVIVIVDQTSATAMSHSSLNSKKAPNAVAVTLSDDKSEITFDAEGLEWVVTKDGDNFKFGVSETTDYLYATADNNGLRIGDGETNVCSIENNGTADFITIQDPKNVKRYIGVYNSTDWRCYTTINTNIKECVTAFYKKEASDPSDQSVATTVTIDASGITNTNVFVGTAAGKLVATVSAGESAVEDATVTWTSDNEEVATIDAAGVVTLVAAGTAKLTASYAGVENQYKASSKAYTLTVTNSDPNGPGTENNPYTVAQAIANTPASGNSDEVYIKGIVSSFYKDDIVSDNANYRYYISDDGETTTQLLVYKGTGLNKAAFEKADDLLVGDVVVICGKLTTYSNAPEVAAGNYIVSLTRPDAPVDERQAVEMSFAKASYEATVGEEFTAPELTITEGYDGTVTYASSDETVATVAADGAVTIVAAGTTTITATAPATENYKSATASYELTVNAAEEPVSDADVVYDIADDSWTVSEGVLTNGTVSFAGEGSANFKKNTGYFIMGKNGAYINFPIYEDEVEKIVVTGRSGASASTVMNVFVGEDAVSTETTGCVETNTYVINKDYRTVGTQYALKVLSNHNAQITKIEVYFDKTSTGIQTVNHTNVADGAYFNLAGQRVAAPAKGLYIVNGKKVVLK